MNNRTERAELTTAEKLEELSTIRSLMRDLSLDMQQLELEAQDLEAQLEEGSA